MARFIASDVFHINNIRTYDKYIATFLFHIECHRPICIPVQPQ